MTTVTFQFHCCVLACLCKCAPVYASLRVCCKKKKNHLDCGQSERAVGTETEKAGLNRLPKGCSVHHRRLQPPPLRLPLSLPLFCTCVHKCTHTHTHQPPAVRSPGGSEAHWLIRSQVKHCPRACYNAKVNDKTPPSAHTRLHLWQSHTFYSTCTHRYRLMDPCTATVSIRQLLTKLAHHWDFPVLYMI